jgi:hypothetical protein
MTANMLWDQIPKPYRPSKSRLPDLLERAVGDESLWRFAPYRSRNHRYFDQPIERYAKQVLLDEVSRSPSTANDLKRKTTASLKGLTDAEIKAIVSELVADGSVTELHPRGSRRSSRFILNPPNPRGYLIGAVKRLRQTVDEISNLMSDAGIPREETARVARELVADSLRTPAASADANDFTEGSPPKTNYYVEQAPVGPGRPATDDRILEALSELSQTSRSPLVLAADLRRSLELNFADKSEFDRAVLALSRQGKVSLHRHDYPQSLSADDREMLVTDGKNFFSGIAVRK